MTSKESIRNIDCVRSYLTTTGVIDEQVFKALDMAIEALEKQIPNQPCIVGDHWALCPRCYEDKGFSYNFLAGMKQTKDSKIYYCSGCGQAIDWSDEE